MKERSSALYRLSAYYLSAVTVDATDSVVLPIIDVNIIYWMAGLEPDAGIFLSGLLIVILQNLAVQVGLFRSVSFHVTDFMTYSGSSLVVQ